MKNIKAFLIFIGLNFIGQRAYSASPELGDLINRAYKNNPEIAYQNANFEGAESMASAAWALEDPMIGISTLDRGNFTRYGTITQKIRFPVKYFIQRKAKKSRAAHIKALHDGKKLQIRELVISLYFEIYSTQKIIQLTKANILAVREFSRVAEKKYAAGKSPQGDSMKAHFELTQLELDLIRLEQEEAALQDELASVVNEKFFNRLDLRSKRLDIPRIEDEKFSSEDLKLRSELNLNSPEMKSQFHLLEEAEWESNLAGWEFAPDFQIQYQKQISGLPSDSQIYSIGITFPLWFWGKSSRSSAAGSRKIAREFQLVNTAQKLFAKVKNLKGKVKAGEKTLKIYETSLIPQAEGAYSSSRASYRASRTSFLDLLDSERSLFRVKTGFYRSLLQYVKNLAALEASLGFEVSNLEGLETRSLGEGNE